MKTMVKKVVKIHKYDLENDYVFTSLDYHLNNIAWALRLNEKFAQEDIDYCDDNDIDINGLTLDDIGVYVNDALNVALSSILMGVMFRNDIYDDNCSLDVIDYDNVKVVDETENWLFVEVSFDDDYSQYLNLEYGRDYTDDVRRHNFIRSIS